jgi:hypothetical protein
MRPPDPQSWFWIHTGLTGWGRQEALLDLLVSCEGAEARHWSRQLGGLRTPAFAALLDREAAAAATAGEEENWDVGETEHSSLQITTALPGPEATRPEVIFILRNRSGPLCTLQFPDDF